MKFGFWALAFLFATIAGSSAAAGQSPAIVTPSEKMVLFDGRSLSGWTFVSSATNNSAPSIWSVTNGVLCCQGKPNGYARTLLTYRNFHLHVEWRWPSGPGNSGIFVHLNPPDTVWPLCFEAQLLAGSAGELRLNGGSKLAGLAGSKVISIPRQHDASEKPVGEWNTADIDCRTNAIAIRINGVLQNSVTGASLDSGAIGLQAEGAPVEFRNITLDKLPNSF